MNTLALHCLTGRGFPVVFFGRSTRPYTDHAIRKRRKAIIGRVVKPDGKADTVVKVVKHEIGKEGE